MTYNLEQFLIISRKILKLLINGSELSICFGYFCDQFGKSILERDRKTSCAVTRNDLIDCEKIFLQKYLVCFHVVYLDLGRESIAVHFFFGLLISLNYLIYL